MGGGRRRRIRRKISILEGKGRIEKRKKTRKERKEQVIPLGSALSIMLGICVERAWAERQREQNWRGRAPRNLQQEQEGIE